MCSSGEAAWGQGQSWPSIPFPAVPHSSRSEGAGGALLHPTTPLGQRAKGNGSGSCSQGSAGEDGQPSLAPKHNSPGEVGSRPSLRRQLGRGGRARPPQPGEESWEPSRHLFTLSHLHGGVAYFNGMKMKTRKCDPHSVALVNRAAEFSLHRRLSENVCSGSLELGCREASLCPLPLFFPLFDQV